MLNQCTHSGGRNQWLPWNVGGRDGSDEPPAGGGRSAEVNLHGQKRSNDTHASTSDPDARLLRKSTGQETKLCFMGHALMENRNGLVVHACLTHADGHAERVAALAMIEPRGDRPGRITLGADKGYDTEDFVNELRSMNVAPHVAAKINGSALDGCTTRHAGYVASLRVRKRIEEAFGWARSAAGFALTRHRGLPRVGWQFTLAMAAYNLVRLPKLPGHCLMRRPAGTRKPGRGPHQHRNGLPTAPRTGLATEATRSSSPC